MSITLGNTTITGLSVGGLPNNTITAANMATNGNWAPTSTVVRVTTFRNSTRTSVPTGGGSGFVFWNPGPFTKVRANSNIVIRVTVFGAGFASGNCGVGVRVGNTWDHGMGYQYDSSYAAGARQVIGSHFYTGLSAGSHTIGWGWRPASGGTGERPFNIFNPNFNDDGRNQQKISTMIVYEVAT